MEISLKTLSGSSRSSTSTLRPVEPAGMAKMKKVSFLLHVIGEEQIYTRFHISDVRLN